MLTPITRATASGPATQPATSPCTLGGRNGLPAEFLAARPVHSMGLRAWALGPFDAPPLQRGQPGLVTPQLLHPEVASAEF